MSAIDSFAQNGQTAINGSNGELTAAQRLLQKHGQAAHKVEIEDVPDEADLPTARQSTSSVLEPAEGSPAAPNWAAPMSTNAAGKRKADSTPEKNFTIDTQDEELFPGLGAANPKQTSGTVPIWKVQGPTASNRTSNSASGSDTPAAMSRTASQDSPAIKRTVIPGQITRRIAMSQGEILPRAQLKKPVPDIMKDINRKSKANLSMQTGDKGIIYFTATGPQVAADQALVELIAQVGVKTTRPLSVPRSTRPFIIGKQGSTIKALQERTGARIKMPKMEEAPNRSDDDDDATVDITLEGNSLQIRHAIEAIQQIVGERTATVNTKLRSIPAELYPFIAGAHNARVNALEEAKGCQIRVPPHHRWTAQPPPQVPRRGEPPAFMPAVGDNHISLSGDRLAVQAARAEIEQLAQELQRQLTLEQFAMNRGRHQFIIGERGVSPQEFFAETGCAIILPGDSDDEVITIVGAPDQIQSAMDKAMDLAMGMQTSNLDISRHHRNAPDGARAHARNVTQYLRDRKVIEQIEKLHQAHIVTPMDGEGLAAPWELYSRDGKNAIRAQSEISNIVTAHPPSRLSSFTVDPFYHQHLRTTVIPKVQTDYGVRVVIPPSSDVETPVLLVYEGANGSAPDFEVSRGQPSQEEIRAFQQGLNDARNHILNLIAAQPEIIRATVEVPYIFHEKLKKFIKKEQADRSPDQIPVRVMPRGTQINLSGPAPAVEALTAKVKAFVEQAVEDEKERGFVLSFDFPQKHANQLIGKGGSHIRELMDRFDVEIKVNEGKVDVKGPKAKAEAAKAHIITLGKQWADETTHTLKVDPKFHRELIGAQGTQINRLQTRYKVQIHFPRSAKLVKDDQSTADAASEAGRKPRREQAPDEVVIKGPKKGADEARDEILSLLQYFKDISHSDVVTVQQSQVATLIGQRGREMEEIRRVTGAKIDVPNAKDAKEGSDKVEILIKGTKSQVAEAKKLLAEKKRMLDNTVTKSIEVDRKHYSALIGPGGSHLRDITVEAGGEHDSRTVQFPRSDNDNTIIVKGPAEVVDKIIASMQKSVSERENQTTQTVDVPTDKHRMLIGRGGDARRQLEAQLKVVIKVPKQDSGATGVKVTGGKEEVEKAVEHINALVKEREGQEAKSKEAKGARDAKAAEEKAANEVEA